MKKLDFSTALLLAPLAYALHHAEENLILDFRAWRLSYLADNNPLSTEAVFVILSGITMIFLVLHGIFRNRASAWTVLVFLMATQVVNAAFHLGGTILTQHYSPGTLTGLLLYLPVNFLIARAAIREAWVSWPVLLAMFVVGAGIFAAFELVGPFPMVVFLLICWGWTLVSGLRAKPAQPGLEPG